MKKVLGLGLLAIAFASCSDDDSGSTVDMSLLVGKWYNQSVTSGGQTVPYDDHEVCGKDYIEFLSNGTVKQVDVYGCDGTTPETWEFEGNYTTSGNNITITIWGESATATVNTLNANTLKVTYEDDFDEDGTPETYSETYTSTP